MTTLDLAAAPGAPAAAARPTPRLQSWQLFAVMLLGSAALAWANNEYVMTREVFHNLLGGQMEPARVEQAYRSMRAGALWTYLLTPLMLAARLGVVALLLQVHLLLFGVEAPFRRLWRAALWAFPALLYAGAVRLAVLVRTPAAEIDQAALSAVPGSVAAYFPALAEPGTPLHVLLSLLTQWELLWGLALVVALRHAVPAAGRAARVAAVAGSWCVITFFQWLSASLLAGLGS